MGCRCNHLNTGWENVAGAVWSAAILVAVLHVAPAAGGGSIPGLDEALDPAVTVGTTINIAGPPSSARDCGTMSDNSLASVQSSMETYKGPGSVYDNIHTNYPTVANPSVSLAAIGPLIQQPYDSIVMSRVNTPAVTSITVEHLTLIYPVNYFNNAQPVTVRARRLTFNASGRTLVSYYANYDKVQNHQDSVIWQINGHFGGNPTRQGFGIQNNGGLLGGALGKIAMQGLPIITYDDHNVGESSGGPASLPRTLESLQMMDRTLMTQFDRVDVVGLSGGTERAYHLMMFFESNVKSSYFGGFAVPLWTRLTVPPFGTDGDTHDVPFLEKFGFADLAVMGLHRGVHTAITHNTFEGGRSKYGYWVEMIPIMEQYTTFWETRGDDLDGDGVSDTGENLCHEYSMADLLEWIETTRAIGGGNRIFHVDAAAPGGDPKNTWMDWESGADLSVQGPEFSPGNDSYAFDGVLDVMEGAAGDESLFDFGRTDAWTVVVYARADDDTAHDGGVISKMSAATNSPGWAMEWKKHDTGEYTMVRAHDAADRAVKRVDASPPDTGWHLAIVSMNGPHIDDVSIYQDASTDLPDASVAEPLVAGAMLNDEPLRVGINPFGGAGSDYFRGEIGFIEIWEGAVSQDYATLRWNAGNPTRLAQSDVLVPTIAPAPSSLLRISFPSILGITYRLHFASDIISPTWTDTGFVIEGNGSDMMFSVSSDAPGSRIYRLAAD